MEGIIVNFRGSHHTQYENHMIVAVDGVNSREQAAKLVGKKVTWKASSKKELVGVVQAAHGNKGAVRVIFEKGMPGQSLSQPVSIS
ncbi:50S ribosomal protein L35ae [Candidatus Woesearchaeota archaeon]|nr:50S ribosomal protein L35ae [Candidatus Woesearchaeota archaeon]